MPVLKVFILSKAEKGNQSTPDVLSPLQSSKSSKEPSSHRSEGFVPASVTSCSQGWGCHLRTNISHWLLILLKARVTF